MIFSGRRVVIVLALVGALLAALVVPAIAKSPEERRLGETRARVTEVRKQIEAVERKHSTRALELAEAQRQVGEVLDSVAAAERAVQRQQQAVENARVELERLREEEIHQRHLVRRRAVSLFKRGAGASMGTVLASADPQEALRRSGVVEVLNRLDRRRFEQVTISQVAVEAQAEVLEAEQLAMEGVLDEQRALLAEVEKVRQSRALALAGVDEQLEQLQAQERHLESEGRQLAALARRSSARAGRGGGVVVPGPVVGGWTWPVRGSVTSEYGPRWGRQHEGIDIGARSGTPLVAARDGVLTYTGRMGGYGLLTLVDHGGGLVTAYAHQNSIRARSGQRVSAGDVIGSVGCSGHCTGPHLHFEVRVNGAPRNPRNYLP